jgi:CO dehydrogenase maturation factor
MEAGVEHFGRGVIEAIDAVLVVADLSYDSLKMAEKIKDLVLTMNKRIAVVLNKTPSESMRLRMKSELAANGINVIGDIPNDNLVAEASWEGSVPNWGKAFEAAGIVLNSLLSNIENPNSGNAQRIGGTP